MKAWRWALLGLLLILLLALAWRELSRDPGYVQIIWRGYSIESSLVIGVGLIVGAWLALKLLIGLLLFPFRALSRRSRRVARRRPKACWRRITDNTREHNACCARRRVTSMCKRRPW